MKYIVIYILFNIFFHLEELETQIEDYIRRVGDIWVCLDCGNTAKTKQNIRTHVETHLNLSYNCKICEKVAPTSNALKTHMSRAHKNLKPANVIL